MFSIIFHYIRKCYRFVSQEYFIQYVKVKTYVLRYKNIDYMVRTIEEGMINELHICHYNLNLLMTI